MPDYIKIIPKVKSKRVVSEAFVKVPILGQVLGVSKTPPTSIKPVSITPGTDLSRLMPKKGTYVYYGGDITSLLIYLVANKIGSFKKAILYLDSKTLFIQN